MKLELTRLELIALQQLLEYEKAMALEEERNVPFSTYNVLVRVLGKIEEKVGK